MSVICQYVIALKSIFNHGGHGVSRRKEKEYFHAELAERRKSIAPQFVINCLIKKIAPAFPDRSICYK